MIHLRKSTADSIAALKKQAMDELSAVGVTFPVKVPFFFVAGNTVAQDNATVLKQCFTDSFGDDFISWSLAPTSPASPRRSASHQRRDGRSVLLRTGRVGADDVPLPDPDPPYLPLPVTVRVRDGRYVPTYVRT